MMPATSEQIADSVSMISALSESIRQAGRIPSGHLYAMVIDRLSIEHYERLITVIKRAGLVVEVANELRWIGPQIQGRR